MAKTNKTNGSSRKVAATPLTKEQLQKTADSAYFPSYPKETSILATNDGMFFLMNGRTHATDHANLIKSPLFTINKSGLESQTTEDTANAASEPTLADPNTKTPTDKWSVKNIKAFMVEQKIDFDDTITNRQPLLDLITAAAAVPPVKQ